MTPKTNILLLSAGRRVELLQAFQHEIAARSLDVKVFATDLKPHLSSACQIADREFMLPRVSHPEYIHVLSSLCQEHNIGVVVPTIDTELLVLARHREKLAETGVQIVISDESLVAVCRDKRRTGELFRALEIDTPEIYHRSAIRYPCFAKPYDGSSSIGAFTLADESALSETMLSDEKLIFMELINSSFAEYTVDLYYNRRGQLVSMVPRERIEVRGGEVSKGVTRRNRVYDYLLSRMQRLQGASGCITLQLFANQETGRFAAIEINPRFGGGYPLSYSAGANYPGWLIDEYLLNKEVPFYDGWEPDLMMLRYDAKVLVHGAT